mmetsp:Transcript_20176/g.81080  ORF Transcript_20176/g.81080 Transcript_20176/m.81080 type:complete len:127 (+) Transcript_20176:222-602(+)
MSGAFVSLSTWTGAPMGRRKPELSRRRVVTAVMTPTQAEKAGKKLNKVEYTKENSDQLLHPVQEEMLNDEIFVTESAYQILKFHGTYQQDDREKRKAGKHFWSRFWGWTASNPSTWREILMSIDDY